MIDLTRLFIEQSKLDKTIALNHNIDYPTTHDKRLMALLVEIGELANATRCFKFWSNKGSENKDIVLDEYADGLHFFLSIGLEIKTTKYKYNLTKAKENLTLQFLEVYKRINLYMSKPTEKHYIAAFQAFLNLLKLFKYRFSSLEKAYFKKLEVNYSRQKNNY